MANNGGTLNNGGVDDKIIETEESNSQCVKLPPGYKFKPFDFELIIYYLKPKLEGQPLPADCVNEVNIYAHDPASLQAQYKPADGEELYFFTPRDRKYKKGMRPSRAANGGYWKATGKDVEIKFDNKIVGFKKNLVFYRGTSQESVKTHWIMHEYRLDSPPLPCGTGENGMKLDDYVLCRIHNNKPNKEENQLSNEAEENQENIKETRIEEIETPKSYGETRGYVDSVNMLGGESTMMGCRDIQSIKMENNSFGDNSFTRLFPNNHLTFRVSQVPQPYLPNDFDDSVQMVVPLNFVKTNPLDEMMINEYLSTVYMPSTIQKEEEDFEALKEIQYYWKEEEITKAQERENPFNDMPEQSDCLRLDNICVKDEEGNSYNNKEVSNPSSIEQSNYGIQDKLSQIWRR